jgi:hypothetical protein
MDEVLAQICSTQHLRIHCASAQLQAEQTRDLSVRYQALAGPAQDILGLSALNRDCTALLSSAADLRRNLRKAGLDTTGFEDAAESIHKSLLGLSQRTIALMLADLGRDLAKLERAAKKVDDPFLFPLDRAAWAKRFGTQGGHILNRLKTLSLAIDDMGDPADAAVIELRGTANGCAVRLAGLRDRLIAGDGSRGLPALGWDLSALVKSYSAPARAMDRKVSGDMPHLAEVGFAAGREASLAAQFPAFQPPHDPRARMAGSILDVPRVPPSVPPISAEPTRSWRPEFGMQIKALHRAGISVTAGDPAGRAGLVHTQYGDDTCSIVSQQQILVSYGVIPRGACQTLEDRLRSEALASGFYKEGTPSAYSGDLLLSHGLVITKLTAASPAQLEAAAKKGKMLLVGVDPGILWQDKDWLGAGHDVVITGVEYLGLNGKVLGYYINDSGTRPPSRGKFIPVGQFLKAWKKLDSQFIEVQ